MLSVKTQNRRSPDITKFACILILYGLTRKNLLDLKNVSWAYPGNWLGWICTLRAAAAAGVSLAPSYTVRCRFVLLPLYKMLADLFPVVETEILDPLHRSLDYWTDLERVTKARQVCAVR